MQNLRIHHSPAPDPIGPIPPLQRRARIAPVSAGPQRNARVTRASDTLRLGSGPARPIVTLSGTSRASWLRILPARHAFAVCRAGHQDWQGTRENCYSPPGATAWPSRKKWRRCARNRKSSLHPRQALRPQNPTSARLPRSTSARPLSLPPTYSSWLNRIEIWFASVEILCPSPPPTC